MHYKFKPIKQWTLQKMLTSALQLWSIVILDLISHYLIVILSYVNCAKELWILMSAYEYIYIVLYAVYNAL